MKIYPGNLMRRAPRAALAARSTTATSTAVGEISGAASRDLPVPPRVARRVLFSLMFPAMLMPLASAVSNVALPAIRDEFAIQADLTAWITTVFTLPFMVLMPVYGRLSDGVGKRRLILAGIVIFAIGTATTLVATDLAWLMAGRAIQGLGTAGMVPLGIALISSIFRTEERGEALGSWSSVGPMVGFVAPLAAGFLVDHWGWRAAFMPPLLLGLVAFVVIAQFIPAGLSTIRPHFWRRFDWIGVVLLSGAVTAFLFYLSSRPITGMAPLQDWRLLAIAATLFVVFLRWERRRDTPFVLLSLFHQRGFTRASLCASLRMITMAGGGFLLPLYLVDVHGLNAITIGGMLMVSPGTMALVVRQGGRIAGRWGSRLPVVSGASVQAATMFAFSLLPSAAPLWTLVALLAVHGLGVGLMLAPLHYAAMGSIVETEVGAAAGLYSMVRFAGSAVGTALIGVLLQHYLDQALPAVQAYQHVYLFLAGVSAATLLAGLGLKRAV